MPRPDDAPARWPPHYPADPALARRRLSAGLQEAMAYHQSTALGSAQAAHDGEEDQRLGANVFYDIFEYVSAKETTDLAAAVARARQWPAPAPSRAAEQIPEEGSDAGGARKLSASPDTPWGFIVFFTGFDGYGQAARAYAERYYPEYRKLAARSIEEMFELIGKEMTAFRMAAGEIILVTHANAHGGMKIPLLKDDPARLFTPWDVSRLQEECLAGKHPRFLAARARVVRALGNFVKVRGCELGKSPEALRALRILFGGRTIVLAPTVFQGFSVELVGGRRLRTPAEAYDWLANHGYPVDELAEPGAKAEYISRRFGRAVPTEFFLATREAHDAFDRLTIAQKLGPEGERLKERPSAPMNISLSNVIQRDTGEPPPRWEASFFVPPRKLDRDLRMLPRAELVRRAEALSNPYRPGNADLILRLLDAWLLPLEDQYGRIFVDTSTPAPPPTPGVFASPNIDRARADAPRPDDFLSEKIGYARPSAASAAAAADYASSETLGVVAPEAVAPAAVPGSEDSGIERDDHLRLWGFETGSAELRPGFAEALRAFAAGTAPGVRVSVIGHSDAQGSAAENLALGGERARAVANVLTASGVPEAAVSIESHGEAEPLKRDAASTPAHARARNRRVEIVRALGPSTRPRQPAAPVREEYEQFENFTEDTTPVSAHGIVTVILDEPVESGDAFELVSSDGSFRRTIEGRRGEALAPGERIIRFEGVDTSKRYLLIHHQKESKRVRLGPTEFSRLTWSGRDSARRDARIQIPTILGSIYVEIDSHLPLPPPTDPLLVPVRPSPVLVHIVVEDPEV
jgi:outer membrane protein OmpA-like peptidoglycan-associated protein